MSASRTRTASARPESARPEKALSEGRFLIGTPFHRELLDPSTGEKPGLVRVRQQAQRVMHAVAHFCAPPVESQSETQRIEASAMTLDLGTESRGIGWTEQLLVWGGALTLLALAWLTA